MESNPGKWEYLEHTADAKFKAYGETLDELFTNCAKATFAIITDIDRVKKQQTHPIEIKAQSGQEAALFDFLDQLLFLLDTEGFLLRDCKVRVTRNCDGSCWVTGEAYGDYHKGYDVSCNVKAVTYNDMFVRIREGGGWEAQVVVDL